MSTFSTDLKIELIGTGEQSGTWGTTTNSNFSNVFEQALVGRVTVAFTDADVTLTATDTVNSQSYRRLYLNCTGANTANKNLIVPTINKTYVVQNNTTGGFAIVVKTSAGTGVTVPNGKSAAVYANGTDVVQAFDYFPTATVGTLSLTNPLTVPNGGTGLSSGTSGGIPYFSASNAITSSGVLAANALVIGGGAGVAPATTATGTGVVTALGTNVGSAGAFVVNGGALGTPSSGTVTNLTGTASININGTVGATTPSTGAFTTLSASGVTTVSAGTVSAPAITTTGDTNTGIFFPAADTIAFTEGGTEAMRITSAGNLDIGGSAYARRLSVKDATNTVVVIEGSNTGSSNINFADSDSENPGSINYGHTTNYMAFQTAGSERMRIDSSGNVSVGGTAARGTTAGSAHLDIFNGTAPAGTLTNGISLYSSSGDFNFMDSAGNGYKVGFRNVPAVGTKTGSYTLATGDVGKYVQVGSGGSITIPDATFAEGDVVSIFNNTTGNITITCSITTAYIAGTDSDKATMTLATRGVATILFISGTVCVVSGNVT